MGLGFGNDLGNAIVSLFVIGGIVIAAVAVAIGFGIGWLVFG